MQTPYVKEHPTNYTERRNCLERARFRKSQALLYPRPRPEFPPNHCGSRRATRAALAVLRRRGAVNV